MYRSGGFVGGIIIKMASNTQPKISKYFSSLDFTGRKRYLEKLKVDGQEMNDPFAISEDQWSKDLTK